MFATCQRHPSSVRLGAPPRANDTLHRSAATHSNPAWHRLATGVRVSQPHDPAEREADRVADAVTRGEAAEVRGASGGSASIHRMCAECEEEQNAAVHAKRDSGSSASVTGDGGSLSGLEGRGHPMDATLRGEFEPRFGQSFGDLRLHTDSHAAQSAQGLDALAYTYGRHVVFGAGQFDPSSMRGRHLLAHELAHVVQQSHQSQPALQRQKGDWKLDPCVSVPGAPKLCGQAAADACKKASWIPGCSLVCKAFDCGKPKEPETQCPTGWRASSSKDFEGQCCQGGVDNAQHCCTPDRIATGSLGSRCCPPGEVVSGGDCKRADDLPPLPPTLLCPSGQRTLKGECCVPPMVSNGLACVLPDPNPPKPPAPQPMLPRPIDIFFKLDRPQEGEGNAALASVTTAEGKANFDALVASLKADSTLKVQLVGRASPEGTEAYNLDLGARRARLIAEALKGAGISESQIADPPVQDLRVDCQLLGAGLATCGKAGATGASDREVMARVF